MFFFSPSSSSFFSQITKSKEEEEEEVDDAVDRKSDTANENGHNRELSLTRCDRRCVTQFVKNKTKHGHAKHLYLWYSWYTIKVDRFSFYSNSFISYSLYSLLLSAVLDVVFLLTSLFVR